MKYLLAFLLFVSTAQAQNIVVVLTDDQDDRGSLTVMPEVEALAAAGTRFVNSYAANPLCAPSRAAFLTGQYPHNNRVWYNHRAYDTFKPRAADSLGPWLQSAGYDTAYLGKFVNGYTGSPPPGWTEWRVFDPDVHYFNYTLNENGTLTPHGSTDADYSTDYLKRKAVQWLRSRTTKPFVLIVAPKASHLESGKDYAIPAPRHAGHFASLPLPQPPNFNEYRVADKPGIVQRLTRFGSKMISMLTTMYRSRMETLLAVDETVGALRRTLAETGHAEDTVFVFTSDNGYAVGEHRWIGKHLAYQEQAHVPLVVYWPGRQPQVRQELVSTVDLTATIAEIAHAAPTVDLDGKSLVPLVMNTASSWRTALLAEGAFYHLGLKYEAVITATETYIKSESAKYGREIEHYDRATDPWELANERYSRSASKLLALLKELAICEGQGCWK